MPVHPTMIKEDGDDKPEVVFVCSTDAASNKTSAAAAASATTSTSAAVSTTAAASASATTAGGSTVEHPRKEFYNQLIVTMNNFAAPQYQQKVIVESREHKKSINLAKLQSSMLRLMYASREIDWDEGTVQNIQLATFAQGFKNLLDRLATVQATQLANLFTSVFSTKAGNNNDDSHLNPLNRRLSLFIFTPKFTKAHLRASFHNVDLELGAIYKSTSINPFQYAPQTNCTMVKVASSELEEECNELNWRITDKDKKQVTTII